VRIHLAPVLLGAGTRLLDDDGHIGLQPTRITESSKATHLRYWVLTVDGPGLTCPLGRSCARVGEVASVVRRGDLVLFGSLRLTVLLYISAVPSTGSFPSPGRCGGHGTGGTLRRPHDTAGGALSGLCCRSGRTPNRSYGSAGTTITRPRPPPSR
jgi:hypothetical protein